MNLHRCKLASVSLCNGSMGIAEETNPLVALLQEPYTGGGDSPVGIPRGVNKFCSGRNPRSLILTNKSLIKSSTFTDRDVVICEEHKNGKTTFYVSVYWDINFYDIPKTFVEFMDYQVGKTNDIIIGMDANAHSEAWGCEDANGRGEKLEQFIANYGLSIINRGSTPTFVTSRAQSIIDITLTSKNIEANISGWQVHLEDHFSDHRMISCYQKEDEKNKSRERYINLNKCNWDLFSNFMYEWGREYRTPPYWTKGLIDKEMELTIKAIGTGMANSSPYVHQKRPKSSPWWSKKLESRRKELKALQKKLQTNLTDEEKEKTTEDYKVTRTIFKKEVRNAKAASWSAYVDGVANNLDMAKFIRIISNAKNPKNQLRHLKKPDGSYTKSITDINNLLLDTFCPDSSPIPDKPTERETSTAANDGIVYRHNLPNIFSPEKVKRAINSFGKNKAPGPDGIRPIALQHLDEGTFKRLSDIFEASVALKYVPKILTKSKLIFIPKPGKDPEDPRSVRPITLSSFVFKTMERVIYWNLEENGFVENISESQHAYRRNKSTETALVSLVDKLESAVQRNKLALGVFLDISGAFDNILINKIIEQLEAKNFPQWMVQWYQFALTNREIKLTTNGEETKRKLNRGTPQGGILSPLAFNLAFDPLLHLIKRFKGGVAHPIGYADDASFVISGICQDTLIDIANALLREIFEWGNLNGLKFAPHKTEGVLFHSKKTEPKIAHNLEMNGKVITLKREVKYLGLILNNRLRWNSHIHSKVRVCKSKIMTMKNAIGGKWGPTPKCMMWFFKSYILSTLSYGSLIWAHSKFAIGERKAIDKVERLAMYCMAPIKKSTPQAGLRTILGVTPTEEVIRKRGLESYIRNRPNIKSQWDGTGHSKKSGFLKKWKRIAMEENVDVEVERKKLEWNWAKPTRIAKPRSGDSTIYLESKKVSSYRYFKEYNGYSYRFIFQNEIAKQGTFLVKGENSFLRNMEAFNYVGQIANEIFRNDEPINLVTSISTTFLNSPISRWETEAKAKKSLTNFAGLRVGRSLFKKKRFSNVAGAISKFDLQKQIVVQINPTIIFAKSHPDMIKDKIESNILDRRKIEWRDLKSCRHTKIFFPIINDSVSVDILNYGRITLSKFIKFFTGHCNSNRHRNLEELSLDPVCRLCLENEEEPSHLLFDCPALWQEQIKVDELVTATPHTKGLHEWSLEGLDGFLKEPSISFLFNSTLG